MWQSQVVRVLREYKNAGVTFDEAWDAAMLRCPPRGTGFGNGRAQLSFEEEGEPSIPEFLRSACRDAWYGEKPQLRHLSTDLLDVPVG